MAGVAKRIEVQIGDALAIVKKTPGMFDVIFIDVDKNQYPAALHCPRPIARINGAATPSKGAKQRLHRWCAPGEISRNKRRLHTRLRMRPESTSCQNGLSRV
jgi:hypothetical protein